MINLLHADQRADVASDFMHISKLYDSKGKLEEHRQ